MITNEFNYILYFYPAFEALWKTNYFHFQEMTTRLDIYLGLWLVHLYSFGSYFGRIYDWYNVENDIEYMILKIYGMCVEITVFM